MMAVICFIFFLFLDVSMIGLCAYCYSGKENWQEGMILGIHVPREAQQDPQVQALAAKHRKMFRRFQWLNLLAALAFSALCFVSIGIGIFLWSLWCMEYIFGILLLGMAHQRQMYAIKQQRRWYEGECRTAVAVDTRVSAMAGRFPFSWQWHLPALAAGLCLWAFPGIRGRFLAEPGEWLFPLMAVLLPVFFIALHICLAKRKNEVFSQDSAINETLNRLQKRAWTGSIIGADYASFAGILYLCLRFLWGETLDFADYLFFCAADFLGALCIVAAVIRIRQRRREILEADRTPVTVDDDEYWKNGWYSNPNDRHLFVQSRMNSTSYSMNMARPAAKWWVAVTGVICVAAIGVCLFIAVLFGQLEHASTKLDMEGHTITISNMLYDCSFAVDDIQEIQLLEELPDEDFSRTNGAATDRLLVGYFEGESSGRTEMFLFRHEKPLICVKLPEKTVFFNSDADGETEEWYEMLRGL